MCDLVSGQSPETDSTQANPYSLEHCVVLCVVTLQNVFSLLKHGSDFFYEHDGVNSLNIESCGN